MENFRGFGLSHMLVEAIEHKKYTTPTPIQVQSIPLILQGQDIVGTAQTGTGKTAAFAIPLVEKLLLNANEKALVVTPTRELGKQVMSAIYDFLPKKSGIKTATLIGGENIENQIFSLSLKPRVVVGTPGRINDLIQQRKLDLSQFGFVVLDETDRMLDLGFSPQLDTILKCLPTNHQTLMFSATFPQDIMKLAKQYLISPQHIAVGETNVVAQNIKQEIEHVEQSNKYEALMKQLETRTGSIIIFVKTKQDANNMANNLQQDGISSDALHGDLKQFKRDRVMTNFRRKKFKVLVATDIAARGLDIPHIEHVINYDLPQVAEDFIHRMGRTARAGAVGSALSFISKQDSRKWHEIECLLDPEAAKKKRALSRNSSSNIPKQGTGFGSSARPKRRKSLGDVFKKPKKDFSSGKTLSSNIKSKDDQSKADSPFTRKKRVYN